MHIDREATELVRDLLEQLRPAGPFVGVAPAVEVEVDLDGTVMELTFDAVVYRTTPADGIGAAIVAAHRKARMAAHAGSRQAVLSLLDGFGIPVGQP